ncbi:MAG: flagellar motor protein MotB [Bdellovibrionota bacterium]
MADKKGVVIIKKNKRGGEHGAHGGAWKVAYADFVTAMMCFFLVMWLMGTDEETKAAVAHYFNHPNTPWKEGRDPSSKEVHPLGEQTGSGDSILQGAGGGVPDDLAAVPQRNMNTKLKMNRELSELVQEVMDGQVYAIDVNIEYMKFSLPADALFKQAGTQLQPEASVFLEKLGRVLKGFDGYVTVEGHTDDPPASLGVSANAYEFSLARAVSVMEYLVNKHYIREDKVTPVGVGPKKSVASNESNDGRKKNRRIEFTLSLKQQIS